MLLVVLVTFPNTFTPHTAPFVIVVDLNVEPAANFTFPFVVEFNPFEIRALLFVVYLLPAPPQRSVDFDFG